MGKLFHLVIWVIFFSLTGVCSSNNNQKDSLILVWENENLKDTERIKALMDFIWDKELFVRPAEARKHARSILSFAKERGLHEQVAAAYNTIGVSQSFEGDNENAIKTFEKSYLMYKKTDEFKKQANTLTNIGICYAQIGDLSNAIEKYNRSLNIYEKINYKQGIADVSNNIGNFYVHYGELHKALPYHLKSLKIYTLIKDQKSMAMSYNNVGISYNSFEDHKQLKLAESYFLKSLKLSTSLNYKTVMAQASINLGYIELARKNNKTAIDYFTEGLELYNKIDGQSGKCEALIAMSDAYMQNESYDLSTKYAQEALTLSKSIQSKSKIKLAADLLYKNYKKLKREDLALEHLELFISINNEEHNKEIIQQELQYKFDKKKEITLLKHQKEINEKEIESKFRFRFVFIGILIFIFSTLILYHRLRITRIQRKKINDQKDIIEKTHAEIQDSITYTKRIQDSILPTNPQISISFPKSFVYFKPKDIVSGDFYFVKAKEGVDYFAVADCTGHGVPGAMISIVCWTALKRSFNLQGISQPNKILDETRKLVVNFFENSSYQIQDGMDIALCSIQNNTLSFSGANNNLWIVRKTELLSDSQRNKRGNIIEDEFSLIELKGDRQPISVFSNPVDFSLHEIKIFDGDCIYLSTDGFPDQFGGGHDKKYKSYNLKKLLLKSSQQSMLDQENNLSTVFDKWKGNLEQIDDVCVFGIRHVSKSA